LESPDKPGSPAGNEPDRSSAPMLERKLVTILSADVAEYSRLMAEDEEQTVHIFREHSQTFRVLVEAHQGRIFNTAGDAILAEFTSPVEAVRCATDIQAAVRTRNEQLPLNRQVKFRIGVNIGDVMVQNSDLLGDGVNVAARLQGAAAPGGICISGSVYDQVRNKLSLGFESQGERRFKNIPQPVRTFTLAGSEEDGHLPVAKPPPRRPGAMGQSVVVALSLLVITGGYLAYSAYRQGQAGAPPKPVVPATAGVSSIVTPADAKNTPPPAAAKQAVAPAVETQPPQVRSAPMSDLSRLMRSEEASDNKCTDGSGDLDETGRACAERDRLVEVLADRGWCRQEGKSWQRCAR
jgi:class 3 adenylate cyclase